MLKEEAGDRRRKRSRPINGVKPAENIKKNLQSYPLIVKLLKSIESSTFVSHKTRMSGEFEKRKDITNKIRTNISNISKDTFYVHKVGPGWMRLLSLRSFLLSPAEKLSTITNNTKGPWEYQHHRK